MLRKLLHEHVADHDLEVFSHLHVVDWEMDRVIGQREAFAAGVAEDRITGHVQLAGAFEGLDDVR